MPKDDRILKRISVSGSSESPHIARQKRYRVKIDGKWYEGVFTRQWFGWQFEGYRSGIQLNLIDEVYEIVTPRDAKGRRPSAASRTDNVPQKGPPTNVVDPPK
jgi:hypothetical protein